MQSIESIEITELGLANKHQGFSFKSSLGWTLFSDENLLFDLHQIGFIRIFLLKINKQTIYVFGKADNNKFGVRIFDLSHYPLRSQLDRFKIKKDLYGSVLHSFSKYFDVITEIPSPPFLNQLSKDLEKSYVSVDIKLGATLGPNFEINELHPKIKQSIRRVESSFLINQISFHDMNDVNINDLQLIEISKSKRLSINPVNNKYFEVIKKSKNYYFSLIKCNSMPVAYNVFQVQNKIATYHLNGSDRSEKYKDINKYLMYISLKKLANMGVEQVYFGDWIYESVSSLDLYKARLSNQISFAIRNNYPLSYKGHFYCIYKKVKSLSIQCLNLIKLK
jgi:hypothetical protein